MLRPRPPVRRRASVVVALALALVLVGGCGGDEEPAGPPGDCTRIEGDTFTLVAQNLAWSTDCLQVAEGTELTVTVDNRDQGVQHNLVVSGPSGEEGTEVEAGPVTQTLVYAATEPGRHPFRCDPHPNMTGDLWVDPAPPG